MRQSYEEERINTLYRNAKDVLRDFFDIGDLTAIEAARLREEVKAVFPQAMQYFALLKERAISERSLFASDEDEVISRWLFRLYGIKWNDVHWEEHVQDVVTNELYIFPYFGSKEAKRKRQEIHEKGHKALTIAMVTKAFQEYVRGVRSNVHQP